VTDSGLEETDINTQPTKTNNNTETKGDELFGKHK